MILKILFNNIELISVNHLSLKSLYPDTYKSVYKNLANMSGLAT